MEKIKIENSKPYGSFRIIDVLNMILQDIDKRIEFTTAKYEICGKDLSNYDLLRLIQRLEDLYEIKRLIKMYIKDEKENLKHFKHFHKLWLNLMEVLDEGN